MVTILFSSLILLLPLINPIQGVEEDFNQCGRFSPTGEYTYFCALYVRTEKSSIFLGGGTMIQRNQILSLATLFTNFKILGEGSSCDGYSPKYSLFARCGGKDLQVTREETTEPSSLDRPIQKIFLHPSYNNRSLTNDYAILITTEPFQYSSKLGRVCLPHPGESETDIFTKDCQAIGHGKDGEDLFDNFYSSLLRKVDLSVVKSEDCEEILNTKHFQNFSLGGADNSWRWKIDESFLCAGGVAGLDTCEGDGGGPLLCKRFDVQEVLADSGLNATFFSGWCHCLGCRVWKEYTWSLL
ncbi:ovochymase-1 isoform X2 [Eurytemora carolleeae]|uniref:ovochymase-1 isoform X2 n=1 Tax=Eurytemora carolleeae TaxID=1294199 RepID=UPI000C78909D|nr:ovochymase-1 isoform X2 [Eurytemora carolleeae]|eukprot:XP_023322909.1 ovochymase-1-like isoform X2 [Eurytemora affinis]